MTLKVTFAVRSLGFLAPIPRETERIY